MSKVFSFLPDFYSKDYFIYTSNNNLTPQYYYITPCKFSHQRLIVVFQWSLSDSKSPQVSKTLLIIIIIIIIIKVYQKYVLFYRHIYQS